MGKDSKIEWTESTWNPWHGCTKVSAGCRFCYMYRGKARFNIDGSIVSKSKTNFNAPMKWKEPKLIFTCSLSDWFIENADEWRTEAWKIIKNTPHHTYQILTKRPERINACLPEDWGELGYHNVWIGISCENQEQYDIRSKHLKNVKSQIKFLSLEPLLSHINLNHELYPVDWMIIGGESGNDTGKWRYRVCKIEWIMKLMENVPRGTSVFLKQLGTHISKKMKLKSRPGSNANEWPEHLRVREMPEIIHVDLKDPLFNEEL